MRFALAPLFVAALLLAVIGWHHHARPAAATDTIEIPIPSYALRHVRPGPLVPAELTPTMLAPYDCDLTPGLPPT